MRKGKNQLWEKNLSYTLNVWNINSTFLPIKICDNLSIYKCLNTFFVIKHLHQAFTFLNNIQNIDQRRWYITKQCFLKLCYYVQRNLVSAVGAVFTEKCAVQVLAALRTHLTWTRTGGRRWFLHPAIVTTTPYQTH